MQWKMQLPNAAGQVVNVLAQDAQVFAGCNGRAYSLNAETPSPFTPLLTPPSMGDGAEVRLAIADDTLFVGANSEVRGITVR